jgi:hypothetical protein
MVASGMPDEPAAIDDYKLSVYQIAAILRETPAEVRARTEALRELRRARHPPKPKRSGKATEAVRRRRYRARLKRDVIVLKVEVPRVSYTEALIASGRVSEPEALLREKIEEATTLLLTHWAERWSS